MMLINTVGMFVLVFLYNNMVDFQKKSFIKNFQESVVETNRFTLKVINIPDMKILHDREKSGVPITQSFY